MRQRYQTPQTLGHPLPEQDTGLFDIGQADIVHSIDPAHTPFDVSAGDENDASASHALQSEVSSDTQNAPTIRTARMHLLQL